MNSQTLQLKIKDQVKPQDLAKDLTSLGYESVGISTPSREGEFGKRGNLVDIWLERYKMPTRVDLIDERVENIYLFNPLTQTVVRRLKEIYVVPFGVTPKLAPAWFKKAQFPAGKGKYERLFLSEVKVGDLVVHIDHGIGKFIGLREKYLTVQYAKGDTLSVPIEQIDRLTKYIGAAGYRPKLNSLGTASWEKIKNKVQESVVTAAKDLIALYAKRELATRPSYSSDSIWQKQMEESFEFTETTDQIKAVAQIKKDLESSKPMDRLLVGDVGFGKTEVAMRAAFKVVQDSKQVAILVPTTLLAEQHYFVFKERLAEFPVKVDMLSRFKKEQQQRKTLKGLREGELDIIIGTYRLLSEDVKFKNLGLVVIDEEHRFGVVHKERLKKLRTSVDALSMSATPIPRTLHMALTRLRDISILEQAPIGRQAITTSVEEYNEEKIRKALDYELSRSGQVYYLHNNVATIGKKATEIANLIPKARVVFAHGQMSGGDLERVMDQFYSKKADILVCTTIIGSGIDMPSVNTIFIEDAQNFGLSDLHQLRGRVGRSSLQAFAYLFYPIGYLPTGDVLERFLAIREASELGSGYKIAKKDLEIRGAGNLLGKSQSGNIALVGFELYVQLLNQVIEKLKKQNKEALD